MNKEVFELNLEALRQHFGEDANLIPLQDVAEYLKHDRRTILADGSFPVKKLGRLYFVPVIGLARWLAN